MAYEIPISTGPLDAVINKFNDAAAAVERMNASVSKGERAMRGLDRASAGVGGGSTGGGGGVGRGRGPNSRVYDIARGAEQRYDIAARRLQQAEATGNQTLIADARANLIRQERARARQRELVEGSATHGNAVWDAFMSSRIGPGGKLYPLVNRLRAAGFGSQEQLQAHFAAQGMGPQAAAAAASAASASRVSNTAGALQNLGVSAATAGRIAPNVAAAASTVASLASAAMPLLIPGAVALAGAVVVGGAANAAAASYRAGGDLYYRSGSSAAGVGQLRGIGAFLGKDAGAASDALAGALHNGSYGAAILNSRGIVDMGSFTKDRGLNYRRAIEELTKMPESQAIRVARDTGLQDELWMRNLSPESRKRMLDSYDAASSPDEMNSEAEYRGSKVRLGASWDKMVRTIGKPIIDTFNAAIDGLTDPFSPSDPALKPKGKASPAKAKDDNTAAVEELTRTLKGGRDQVGGGSRSMGAVPAGWKLMTMDSALKSDAMAMGAFGV
jgi:hypothetical protein